MTPSSRWLAFVGTYSLYLALLVAATMAIDALFGDPFRGTPSTAPAIASLGAAMTLFRAQGAPTSRGGIRKVVVGGAIAAVSAVSVILVHATIGWQRGPGRAGFWLLVGTLINPALASRLSRGAQQTAAAPRPGSSAE